ncbi:hypothetical protein VKT23_007318 [Stygiomarasmius scandens]|uniref:Uncharacterized protein n=1 Tax=Marasmiellus scandens TaxID=2682957 RepID=A0ABR1JJJ5_9AGAR
MLESPEEYAKIVQHLQSHNKSWRMIDYLQGLVSLRPTSESDIIENGSGDTHSTDVTDDNKKCRKLNLDALGKLSTEESISHYLGQLHRFQMYP